MHFLSITLQQQVPPFFRQAHFNLNTKTICIALPKITPLFFLSRMAHDRLYSQLFYNMHLAYVNMLCYFSFWLSYKFCHYVLFLHIFLILPKMPFKRKFIFQKVFFLLLVNVFSYIFFLCYFHILQQQQQQRVCKLRGWAEDTPKNKETHAVMLEIWEGLRSKADKDNDGQVS